MSLLSIVGGLIGSSIPGLGPMLGGALGSGIGSLVGGGSTEDALKAAALGGLGGGLLGKTGLGGALGFGTGAGAGAGETTGKGLMSLLTGGGKGLATPLMLAGLGTSLYGVMQDRKKNPLDEYAKLEAYLQDQWDSIDVETKDYNKYYKDLEKQYAAVGGRMRGHVDPISNRYFETADDLNSFYARQQMNGNPNYARGGLIQGPGTGTSDDIPAMIYQDGQPVREAALSNGEVVLSLKDLEHIGNGNAELAGRIIGDAPNGTRGAAAAQLYRSLRA